MNLFFIKRIPPLLNREEAEKIIFRLPWASLTELFREPAVYVDGKSGISKLKTQIICRNKMDFSTKKDTPEKKI